MTRHWLAVAATGTGKSNFLNLILKQQMMRGGGVIHIDGKNNEDAISEFLTLARQHDRWHDVRIINIDNAALSNTYNPLLRGDVEQLVSRIMLLVPDSGKDSFFRSQAVKSLRAIIGLIRAMDLPFCFEDLNQIMSSETALRWLVHNAPKDTRAYADFMMFIDQISSRDFRTGQKNIDEKKSQFAFGDLLGKISAYATGQNVRDVVNAYNPEVDILTAMQKNHLVYIGLPMLAKREAAVDFAKIILSDIQTAVGNLQQLPKTQRPSPTFMVLMDEFSSYAAPFLAPLFEQARSTNVSLFPFVQTIASLSDQKMGLSTDFKDKVIGNTWSKIVFGLEDPTSQEEMSLIAGQKLQEEKTVSFSEELGFKPTDISSNMILANSRGRSVSESIKTSYDAIIRPDEFKSLQPGEAFFVGKDGVYKIRVPEVILKKDGEGIDFPRFRMPTRTGLDMAHKRSTAFANA